MQNTPVFEDIIRVQPKGLVTIPKRFRRLIGLEPQSFARMRLEKRRIIIEPVRTLPYPVRSYTDAELEEFFALDKAEAKQLRKKSAS